MYTSNYFTKYSNRKGQNLEAKVEQEREWFYTTLAKELLNLSSDEEKRDFIVNLTLQYIGKINRYIDSFSYFDSNFKKFFQQHYYISEYRYRRMTPYVQFLIILSIDLSGCICINVPEVLADIKAKYIYYTRKTIEISFDWKNNEDFYKEQRDFWLLSTGYATIEEKRAVYSLRDADFEDHAKYLKELEAERQKNRLL